MKVYTDKDGNALPAGVPFELNNLAFPANWLELATNEDLEAQGIVSSDAPDPEPAPAPVLAPERTPQEKLADLLGVSLEQLKAALS